MERLNWATYKKLQNEMDQINHNCKFSALTLLGLSYYGIKIRFEIVSYDDFKIIFFDLKFNRFISNDIDAIQKRVTQILEYGDHFILMPIFDPSKISVFDAVYCNFYKLKKMYPIKFATAIEGVNEEQLQLLKENLDYEVVYKWNANYLYHLEKLKTFSGKKMQKKRNHLNYFLNHYQNLVTVNKFNLTTDQNDILDFAWKSIVKNDEEFSLNEYIFLKNLLNHIDLTTMSGIVVREITTNQIIGFTIGYNHKKHYEIFFEKADHNWRGLFQFIIFQNLKINNIDHQWIDRQDDMGQENLAISKRSYYPEEIIQLNMIYILDTPKNKIFFPILEE